ncbi:endonuclease/exonuclease/phosphatase family protein [Vibrio metschnikovii]|uniref:endonuclease/exonuclease/phosphatase family protein n=1 Tax=Vibrio metschnikovii TaxID=28172 RepID=UPI001C30DC60|nr:endonuclease/exonuclease/phosphatase family protein [Vibrio metschnikovii]
MTITLATINLFNYLEPPNAFYQFDNIYSHEQWQRKNAWFTTKIQQLNADVIGFQEVFSFAALRQQMNALGYPHVVCVDSPNIEDGYIYRHPVVALASRYPLIQVSPLQAFLPEQKQAFSFHRIPLHATIEVPKIGAIDVYVVHFKSQRATEAAQTPNNLVEEWQQETLGRWLSTVQRGFEVNLTHQYIVHTRQTTQRPFVLMGDFNKPLHHEEFQGLMSQALYRKPETQEPLSDYVFYDSWDIYSKSSEQVRQATHYAGASGSVLDYILLSADFSPFTSSYKGYVSNYTVFDQHLINPSFADDSFSTDHALVAVTITV